MLSRLSLCLFALCVAPLAAQVIDYGDAPAPYPTCKHTQITAQQSFSQLCIGWGLTDDSGTTNPVPGGINADGMDDGIEFSNVQKGKTGTVKVWLYTHFSTHDVLGIWADFNNDGDWNDAGERIVYEGAGTGGYAMSIGMSTFTFAIPAGAVGDKVVIRARIWNGGYSSGFAGMGYGQGGSPTSDANGGECSDYEIYYEGEPEIEVESSPSFGTARIKQSGETDSRGKFNQGASNAINWKVYNRATTSPLTISGVTLTNRVNCGTSWMFSGPVNINPGSGFTLSIPVTPSARRFSFTLNITSNDTTGNESPYIIPFQGGCGMTGSYVVNNAGGADFADIGEAFDEIEFCGLNGAVTLTIKEGSGPYQSSQSYGLGMTNGINAVPNVPLYAPGGTGSTSAPLVTIKAATGEKPVVEGSGSEFRYLWQGSYFATISIGCPWVTIEGLELRNGTDFGIATFANSTYNMVNEGLTIRGCTIHGYSKGAAIAVLDSGTNMLIENNFLYDCSLGQTFVMYGFSTGTANVINGVITFWRSNGSNTTVRNNTVLLTNAQAGTGKPACCFASTYGWINECYGNVFAQLTPGYGTIYIHNGGDEPGLCNYNCWYTGSGAVFYQGLSSSYPTFAAWQSTGRDVQGTNADPMLVSTSAPFDLHLQTGSPCINLVGMGTVGTDIDGDARPQGAAPDAGADEWYPGVPQLAVTGVVGGVIDFGGQDAAAGPSAAVTITLNSTGTAPVNIAMPVLAGADSGDFVLNTTGLVLTLAPGSSTSFSIAFDPVLIGIKSATLTFTHDGTGAASPFAISLSGVGTSTGSVIITTTTLPQAYLGVAYSQPLSALGGTPGYAWSLESGALPAGLSLSPTGAISGTATVTGSFTVVVRATDSVGIFGTQSLGLNVAVAPGAGVTGGGGGGGGGGCAAAAGVHGLWALALLALPMLRRRRAG
ncbi:MAG: choice-of-anchor D domain-containing protein [Planctomycetes bacterium]|nr:choice-of-anchor D domain-containing protein [Planctomycetota bacterium]